MKKYIILAMMALSFSLEANAWIKHGSDADVESVNEVEVSSSMSASQCAANLYQNLSIFESDADYACTIRRDILFQQCVIDLTRTFGNPYARNAAFMCGSSHDGNYANCVTTLYRRGGVRGEVAGQLCAAGMNQQTVTCVAQTFQRQGVVAVQKCQELNDPVIIARKAAEARRAAEAVRIAAEQKRLADQRRIDDLRRQQDDQRRQDDLRRQADRQADEQRRMDNLKHGQEQLKLDQQRQASVTEEQKRQQQLATLQQQDALRKQDEQRRAQQAQQVAAQQKAQQEAQQQKAEYHKAQQEKAVATGQDQNDEQKDTAVVTPPKKATVDSSSTATSTPAPTTQKPAKKDDSGSGSNVITDLPNF